MYRDYKSAADRANAARFTEKVEKQDDGCWRWSGALSKNGYARFFVDGIAYYAHRLALVMKLGRDERDMHCDHLCRNRGCVNPDHLEFVTAKQNINRGHYGLRTHCKHGHSLADATKRKDGGRRCRTCERERARKRRASR